MSSAPRQLAAYALVLVALFAGALLAGNVIDPDARGDESAGHASANEAGHGVDQASGAHTSGSASADEAVHGLAVADRGLRVELLTPDLTTGRDGEVAFRILDDEGRALRDFDVTHTKRMHLILARRDLTGFQHLHPQLGQDGTWTTRATLRAAGSYRLFADFSHGGDAITLATDLRVDGRADLLPLPAPSPEATSDGGYDVRLSTEQAQAGAESQLSFSITRNGETVRTESYLGAGGHLVALREGDMAFLHVHPTDAEGDSVGFAATFPSEGRYRLFLQFQHEGRVQTVAFTQEVGR